MRPDPSSRIHRRASVYGGLLNGQVPSRLRRRPVEGHESPDRRAPAEHEQTHDLSRVSVTSEESEQVPSAGLLPVTLLAQRLELGWARRQLLRDGG